MSQSPAERPAPQEGTGGVVVAPAAGRCQFYLTRRRTGVSDFDAAVRDGDIRLPRSASRGTLFVTVGVTATTTQIPRSPPNAVSRGARRSPAPRGPGGRPDSAARCAAPRAPHPPAAWAGVGRPPAPVPRLGAVREGNGKRRVGCGPLRGGS